MSKLTDILVSKDLRGYLETYEGHVFVKNMTLCQFHEDTNPSLSVDQKNGKGVWYCHGCSKGGTIIDYVMEKYSITLAVAIKKLAGIYGLETGYPKPVEVARYPYHDEQGKILYNILRFNPKAFKADRKMDNIRQVLFNLPKVVKAETVWILEGEKDALNLQKLGAVATTSPFGLSNWKPEFSESLKDKKVRICLDVGTEFNALLRAKSILKAGAAEVKIINLPGLEKTGEDISDWIEMNDSKTNEELKAQLKTIAQGTLEYDDSTILEIKNNFLNLYIDSISRITDAPKMFILFSAIGLLSTVCNKFYFSYPRKTTLNLYILLLAPSTTYRKSTMIDVVSDYLTEVNEKLLLPDSFSTEALLSILQKYPHGLLAWRELIQVKEFQFGSDYNRGLPSLLTDLFDYKPKISRWTKGEKEQVITDPIISILAAGITDWLIQGLQQIDFQGGIWTRFLFVPVKEEKRKFRLPVKFITIPSITEKLKRLDALEAKEMNLSEILPLLERWGERHQEQVEQLDNEILKATFQRLEVALLKIACLLQLGDDETTIVKPKTFQEAVKIIEYMKRILPVFFKEQIVFTEFEKSTNRILNRLKKRKEMTRTNLKLFSHLEPKYLDPVLKQLVADGLIGIKFESRTGPGPKAKIYFYTGE